MKHHDGRQALAEIVSQSRRRVFVRLFVRLFVRQREKMKNNKKVVE